MTAPAASLTSWGLRGDCPDNLEMAKMETEFNRAEALAWYVQGFDLVTIAQHYGMTVDALKAALRTE